MKDYYRRNPGIILDKKDPFIKGTLDKGSAVVLWSNGDISTEHLSYLKTLGKKMVGEKKFLEKNNPENIKAGDTVLVKISPYEYFAKVYNIAPDLKNKKVYANLEKVPEGLPAKVDISDCKNITFLDKAKFL